MKPICWIPLFIVLMTSLAGCAPKAVEVVRTVEVQKPAEEVAVEKIATAPAAAATAAPAQSAAKLEMAALPKPNRLIIKNGDLTLEVEDTDVAIDRVTQIVSDLGGYIISSQTNFKQVYAESYKYASLTLGVPSDDFETAMRRLREIAVRVANESASGQDVTDEYVDLESRLGNLKATRDRIREFLNQAKTVEEALKVNDQLSDVEAEIEQVQGRMNYLFDRSSYSTITVYLEPVIPPVTPTVTPTPQPTPTPTPWQPGQTFRAASSTLGEITRSLVDVAIYFGIVCLPFLIPLGVLVWLGFRLRKRILRRRVPQRPAAAVPETPPTPPADQAPES